MSEKFVYPICILLLFICVLIEANENQKKDLILKKQDDFIITLKKQIGIIHTGDSTHFNDFYIGIDSSKIKIK